jgi:hypothetical protein
LCARVCRPARFAARRSANESLREHPSKYRQWTRSTSEFLIIAHIDHGIDAGPTGCELTEQGQRRNDGAVLDSMDLSASAESRLAKKHSSVLHGARRA